MGCDSGSKHVAATGNVGQSIVDHAAEHNIDVSKPISIQDAVRLARDYTAYVASPYGDTKPLDIRTKLYNEVMEVSCRLIEGGVRVYSPIVHTHHIALAGSTPPGGWYEYDLGMVGLFDVLIVAMLDGYGASQGVSLEVERMKKLNKPILYVRRDG